MRMLLKWSVKDSRSWACNLERTGSGLEYGLGEKEVVRVFPRSPSPTTRR